MYLDIHIPGAKGFTHCFDLSFRGAKYKRMEVEDVCVIDVFKFHNHRYDIKCFFYSKRYIFYRECIVTKKELYNVIQKLLKENL